MYCILDKMLSRVSDCKIELDKCWLSAKYIWSKEKLHHLDEKLKGRRNEYEILKIHCSHFNEDTMKEIKA